MPGRRCSRRQLSSDGRVRLSIAGYQDKIAVYEEAGELALVDGAISSTHILTPEPVDPRLTHRVANEHFCLNLAQAVGVEAAQATIMRLPEPVLQVRRFDRVRAQDSVARLHVIDGCQMLDLTSSYKYERPFGAERDVREIRDRASLLKLFAARHFSVGPVQFALRLLRWTLFQILICNADAHGKNLSCFVTAQGLTLAKGAVIERSSRAGHTCDDADFSHSRNYPADLALYIWHVEPALGGIAAYPAAPARDRSRARVQAF